MSDNLGRDKIWTPEIWAEIDKAVKAEVGQIRIAQKVFPSTQLSGGAVVPSDTLDLKNMTIEEGQTKPFIELSVEFTLKQSQVESEATLRTGRTLARMAAKSLALAEDTIIFQGKSANVAGVRTVNVNSSNAGLLGIADETIVIDPKAKEYPQIIFKHLSEGISKLIAKGQPGPYALILEPSVYADTYSPLTTTLVTTADRISPLMTGGYYASGTLLVPAHGGGALKSGLLVSLGGEPTTIYLGIDATTAFTQADTQGDFRFRVFERIQIVARDPRALVKLEVK
jgi:uncharacterized linocin/CFP29 family protein